MYGNSGADIPNNLLHTVDIVGIYENAFLAPYFSNNPDVNGLAGKQDWHLSQNKSNFSYTVYNITSFDPYYVAGASDYVGYIYITNGNVPQPYSVLPPYFDSFIATLASLVPINITAETLNGSVITSGLSANVTQPDGYSSMGYSPYTFNVVSGSNVTIIAGSHSGYVFDHWSNGETNSRIRVTTSQAVSLIAYYKNTG